MTTQHFYWSVRRELWENRSIYLVPAVIGVLIVLASAISPFHLPVTLEAVDPARQHEAIEQPFMLASLLLMFITVLIAGYYCLEAFQGERRDRSILFWKSMPVSDLTTVASKASIPVIVLPLVAFVATAATQFLMLLVASIRLGANGSNVAELWRHIPLLQMWPMLLFHLVAGHGIWYAPFYGWLLLVSAWARRAPLSWATVPVLALALIEKIAFNTSYFATLVVTRFAGSPQMAGNPMGMDSLLPVGPMQFVTSSGFWLGLAFFALCFAAAVRLRRNFGDARHT